MTAYHILLITLLIIVMFIGATWSLYELLTSDSKEGIFIFWIIVGTFVLAFALAGS